MLLMNYIVLDLEWNQSPSGKEQENKRLPFEIIEIGAVKLDSQMNVVSEFCEIVKPRVYKQLHYKIKEITHIDTKVLSKGRSFNEVFSDFISWCGEDYMLCTWGPMDITELQRNMKFYDFPLFKTPVFFYDIQKIFSRVYEDGKVMRSLEWAIDYLHIDKDIPFHRALSDAHYTSLVMQGLSVESLEKNFSIDCFQKPANYKDEIIVIYDTYMKHISREFDSKTDILEDKRIRTTRCPKCGRKLRKKIHWFSDGSKTYYSLSRCFEHGWIKGRIKLRKSDEDKVYAIKILSLTDNEGAEAIKQRQLDIRKRRRERRLNKDNN